MKLNADRKWQAAVYRSPEDRKNTACVCIMTGFLQENR